MILRAIAQNAASTGGNGNSTPRPIWDAIEESQERLVNAIESWLITQPAHSALSGDIAAKLDPAAFGKFDEPTIRAIALHDAGWSALDSELIRKSREVPRSGATKVKMVAFVSVAPREVVDAWTGSVETALKASAIGGYLVSEHFRSIAQMQKTAKPQTAVQMTRFIAQEDARQKRVRPKVSLEDAQLARLVDGLRFCDLLSLYICVGLNESVGFPQQIKGVNTVLAPVGPDVFRLKPSPFAQEEMFGFAALRHPRTKVVSSGSFAVRITP